MTRLAADEVATIGAEILDALPTATAPVDTDACVYCDTATGLLFKDEESGAWMHAGCEQLALQAARGVTLGGAS